ncbi:small GTP-binding protein [Histomonas meleagridis]|uniref:small GTP-binding protein n=1 Tax=Histomonas meleagridis TaxID=135588 RepID=UPI00355A0D34|nr:small GTP-binding protein [Histomonas meleagridis]KAH0796217.1 small GTP-binding protein [Histomonas meleagridis]
MLEQEENIKVVLLGDAAVGKTSIINYYFGENEEITPTIGAASKNKKIEFNGITYSLTVMDTAGQDAYRSVVPLYLHGANAAVIVMDVSKQDSLESVGYWYNFINETSSDISLVVLCCNKVDLPTRVYDTKDIDEKATELKLTYFETSAVSGIGIYKLFEYIVSKISTSPLNPDAQKNVPVVENKKQSCQC